MKKFKFSLKTLPLLFTALLLTNCTTPSPAESIEANTNLVKKEYQVIVLDSCEYYAGEHHWDLTHKGDCKYCERKLKRLIKEVLDEKESEDKYKVHHYYLE